MNRAEQPAILVPIPDVQSGRDERRIAIDQVGIKGLRYPLPFMDRDRVAHTTIATCNVYVALADDRKGTHMSRLVALLEERAAARALVCRRALARGRRGGVRRALRHLEARRREVRHRASVRQSTVCRGPGAWCRCAPDRRCANRRLRRRSGELRVDSQSLRLRADRAQFLSARVGREGEMRPIAIFRFSPTEGPAHFAEWLDAQGIRWEIVPIDAGAPVPA